MSAATRGLDAEAMLARAQAETHQRHRVIVMAVLNRHKRFDDRFDEALIDTALDMATAALSAPVSKSVRSMLKKSATGRSLRRTSDQTLQCRTRSPPPGALFRQLGQRRRKVVVSDSGSNRIATSPSAMRRITLLRFSSNVCSRTP
jgi:hypothetical protein